MQTELLNITGMACDSCANKVTAALNEVTGVCGVEISLMEDAATVQYDEHQTSSEQLKTAVKNAGYGVDNIEPTGNPQDQGCCCG